MEFEKSFIESLKEEHGFTISYKDYVDHSYKYNKLHRQNDPNAPTSGFSSLSRYGDYVREKFAKLLKENGIEIDRKNS
jgi:hypothetical protein